MLLKEERFFRFDISETEMLELLNAIDCASSEGESKDVFDFEFLRAVLPNFKMGTRHWEIRK